MSGETTPSWHPPVEAPRGVAPGTLISVIHTCYRVTDLDRSLAFYQALGFIELFRFPIGDAISVFMNLPRDGAEPRLELTHLDDVHSDEVATAYGHMAVTTGDLDATLSELARHDIAPDSPPRSLRDGGNRICFVSDPDGYQLEIIERLTS